MKLNMTFALKSGDKTKAPVLAVLSYGNKEFDVSNQKTVYKPLRYYTGVTLEPSEWDKARKEPYSKKVQAQLSLIEKTINEVFIRHYTVNKAVNRETLKQELDEAIKGKARKEDILQRIRIADFIQTDIIAELDKKEQEWKKAGLKKRCWNKASYQNVLNYLEAFEQESGKLVYNHELNEALFLQFMALVRSKNKRYNSVTNIYRRFIAVLHKIERKYKVPVFKPTDELEKDEKQTFIKSAKVFLNFEQIQRVIEHEPTNKTQEKVKLIFLTLLFTGCRYSDVFKIKPDHIYMKGNTHFKYAKYISQKTNVEVAVPILKPLDDAIKANGGQTAEPMDLAYFNKHVKELCRDCGLTSLTKLSYTDSYGVKQFEERPFYEFVGSHTGRRSLVSNLRNHVPDAVLSKITGHLIGNDSNSQNQVDGYDHNTPEESAAMFYRMLSKLQIIDEEHFIYPLAA
jgi:integrase